MPFNFNARYALLTYSQCGDLDGWEVSNHFTKLRAECIVAREAHADGGIHLHAFVDFDPAVNSGRAGAMYSMLEASTQTFHQRTVHHKVASTTRAKMATLSQGDLRDRREALNLAQMLTGAQSSLHQLEMSFCSCHGTISTNYVHLIPFSGEVR